MKVISIINQKGGVGKTTTTYNIAALLAKAGKRVLMIDHDGQASLTLACGYNPIDLQNTIADVYMNGKSPLNGIIETDIENLDLLPADIRLTSAEVSLINVFARETILKKKLDSIKFSYDYVIVDNPPHLGLLTINSLVASNYVIIPCATNPLATYALEDLFNTIKTVKEINTDLSVLGIVATMYNSATGIDKKELEFLKNKYNVIGVIKRSIDASKGLEEGLPTATILPKSDVSKQYQECVQTILKEMEGK